MGEGGMQPVTSRRVVPTELIHHVLGVSFSTHGPEASADDLRLDLVGSHTQEVDLVVVTESLAHSVVEDL
jgi:hypothetical protein